MLTNIKELFSSDYLSLNIRWTTQKSHSLENIQISEYIIIHPKSLPHQTVKKCFHHCWKIKKENLLMLTGACFITMLEPRDQLLESK